jgi:hypothetical protein
MSHVAEWFHRRLSTRLLTIHFSQGLQVTANYPYRSAIFTLLEQQWLGAAITTARNNGETSLVTLFEAALQKPFVFPEGIQYLLNDGFLPTSQMPLPGLTSQTFVEYVRERGAPATAIGPWNTILSSRGSSLLDEPYPRNMVVYDEFDFTTLEALPDGIGIDLGPLILFYCKKFGKPYPPARNNDKRVNFFYPNTANIHRALPYEPGRGWRERPLAYLIPSTKEATLILETYSRSPTPPPTFFNYFPFDRFPPTQETDPADSTYFFRESFQTESNEDCS